MSDRLKSACRWPVAVATMLALPLLGCDCPPVEECPECEESEASFTFVLENDGYGSFMPLSNQFPAYVGTQTPYQSGYFVQLAAMGDFHEFKHIQLVRESGDETGKSKLEFKWVDIVCAPGFPTVLQPHEAQILLPKQKVVAGELEPVPGTEHRRLHQEMKLDGIMALVTLWQGEEGLRIKTSPAPSEGEEGTPGLHQHDMFLFESEEPCEVRVWKDLEPDTQPEVFSVNDPDPVVEVRVTGDPVQVQHGSVHQPPWG